MPFPYVFPFRFEVSLLELELPVPRPGAMVVKVADADVSVMKGSLHVRSELGQRISTARFTIIGEEVWANPSYAIARVNAIGGYTHPHFFDEVKIDRGITPFQNCAIAKVVALGGNSSYLDHFFGGFIVKVEKDKMGPKQRRVMYHCKAQDYNILPMKAPLVTETYVAQTEAQFITDLFDTYLPEIDTTTYVESSGATATLNWTRRLLTEVMEELAGIFSREWYIDYEKKLHYFTPTTTEAPFALSDQPALSTFIGYKNIRHVEDVLGIINRVTVVYDGGVVTRQSNPSYAEYGRWFDAKVVDSNIDNVTWANAVGDAVLVELAFAKTAGSLVCYQEGLVKGQKVRVINAYRNVDGFFLVQSLNLSLVTILQEKVMVEYGDYKPRLTDLLLRISKEERKE